MSAPQLPQVALDGDWFRPDIVYPASTLVRRASQDSSVPSLYSREPGTSSLESAKSSFSFKPALRDDVQHQASLPAVEDHSLVPLTEPTSTRSMASVPVANPDNSFLGFCKGAWNLQNGDQSGMRTYSEADAWSRNASRAKPGHAQYLKCKEPKCEFRSNFVTSNVFLIWNKVFTYEAQGVKLRWPFFAKSHVPQRVVLNSKYSFRCLFCVYLGLGDASTVYHGMDLYLDHISRQHRGKLGDVIEYKTRCISDRVGDDKELFDINIWPLPDRTLRETSEEWLSDELLKRQPRTVSSEVHSILPSIQLSKESSVSRHFIADKGSTSYQSKLESDTTLLRPHHGTLAQRSSPFHYQPWEDNPAEIWGTSTNQALFNHKMQSSTNGHNEDRSPPPCPPFSQAPPLSPSCTPSSPRDLSDPMRQMQIHAGTGSAGISNSSRIGITACLDSIVNLFREASAIIDAIKDNPALSHAPLVRLLAESVKEAPQEIDKERNRANLRFGEAFQYGDYTTICALQQVAFELRSGFLNQLHQAAYEYRPTDVAQLVDAADSCRHTAVAALHDLRKRLVQSGCGAYHQPCPQSHPAHQQIRSAQAQNSSQQIMFPKAYRQKRCQSGVQGHVEEGSAHSTASAASDDASVHVHFREEEIATTQAGSSRRRGSILAFLKHSRTKSGLLLDSKRKSDELAERRVKGDHLQQQLKQEKRKENTGSAELRIAELDGFPVVGRAK